MISVPILFTIISISYISINTVIYDLFIGVITGLIASCITFVFANIIPRVKLEKEKYRQYLEMVKRHGYGLFYAYDGAYSAFMMFTGRYQEYNFNSKALWQLFCRRNVETTIAVERMLSLHSEFNTNICLIVDLIPKECVEIIKEARLDYYVNQVQSSYNTYKAYLSSHEKKYNQELFDIEFRVHSSIIDYMQAMNSIEQYNKIHPGLGLIIFQPLSEIVIN